MAIGIPIVVKKFGSILVVSALKLVLGKMIQCLYLWGPNVVLLLQKMEIVGLVLLEELDQICVHQEANYAICLCLRVKALRNACVRCPS